MAQLSVPYQAAVSRLIVITTVISFIMIILIDLISVINTSQTLIVWMAGREKSMFVTIFSYH